MLPYVKRTAIASVTALALAVTAAAPANAWGRNEQKFVQGAAAALIVGAIINNARHNDRPRYAEPQYYQPPQRQYVEPQYYRPHHEQPRYGRVVSGGMQTSVYGTPAAQAFNSYSLTERRAIQRSLAAQGYYRSGIDGSFGPGTYSAVVAYARDIGAANRLGSRDAAFGVYDALIY